MSDTKTLDREKDLHTAITELILFLKGDGTVSSLQKKTGIHRNMLTAIFNEYCKQRGYEVGPSNPRIKKLYWGTNSLITIARNLGIRVSELIQAAEDVQEGFPPWFQLRISHDTPPHSVYELGNIFLEALGCLTYADPFPEVPQKERQYHRRDEILSWGPIYRIEPYTKEECCSMVRIAIQTIESSELKEFKGKYLSGAITSKDCYRIMKKAVNVLREHDRIEGRFDTNQLFGNRDAFSSIIRYLFEER